MDIDELRGDLAAFADDEHDVVIEPGGNFVLIRHGEEVSGRFSETPEGRPVVQIDGTQISYRSFLTHQLANLPLLAEKLAIRRPGISNFINGVVDVRRPAEEPSTGDALRVLRHECETLPTFAARISFITADAGHGKTALLREYQSIQARDFIDGKSPYLFWHLDLQGRQLLRLSEALMGDLGELRVTGLWMPALIRLMRHRALILAIDGFDELAAEQGGTDALGALASLVTQLGGHGAVIAASRRTFFDTEDYLRRAGIVGRAMASPCQFDQLSLRDWSRKESIRYFGFQAESGKVSAESTYEELLAELGGQPDHPMLTRPFLVAQMARAVYELGIQPAEFVRSVDDPLSGVAAIVEAFVKREVSDKWKFRDTGEPYLSEEQHMHLLSDIAEEMYRSQKDRLGVDLIETLATLLFDQWGIEPSRQQQIIEMVRMHVLLVPPADGDASTRSFDHPEFRDYFTAYALRTHLERVMGEGSPTELGRFLSVAQLSDSTARYVCNMINRSSEDVRILVGSLEQLLSREWRPTFLQLNVGTLLPFILDGIVFDEPISFSGKAIYSSLVFERTRLNNVHIVGGSFVNASLDGVVWRDVTIADSNLGELVISDETQLEGVEFVDCEIEGLIIRDDDEETREYAPSRIWSGLSLKGARESSQGESDLSEGVELTDSTTVKEFRRLLRIFSRTTVISEQMIQHRFKAHAHIVLEQIIPLLEEKMLIVEKPWRGAGSTRVWTLACRTEDVLSAEFSSNDPVLSDFWSQLKGAE